MYAELLGKLLEQWQLEASDGKIISKWVLKTFVMCVGLDLVRVFCIHSVEPSGLNCQTGAQLELCSEIMLVCHWYHRHRESYWGSDIAKLLLSTTPFPIWKCKVCLVKTAQVIDGAALNCIVAPFKGSSYWPFRGVKYSTCLSSTFSQSFYYCQQSSVPLSHHVHSLLEKR